MPRPKPTARTPRPQPLDAARRASMQRALLRWYGEHRRAMPWRGVADPYAIWISEIMLQQTRVDTAVDYYKRFMTRFPTVAALARAPVDDVLKLWAGLGYYRRARMLHAAAQRVVAEFGGALPSDVDSLRSLPGIGDYTAGAIASIAFGVRAPAVDGNVERVLTRWFAWRGDAKAAPLRERIRSAATEFAESAAAPGDWTQALMELGATLCSPTSPRCLLCPVRGECDAQRLGLQDRIPQPRARRATVDLVHAAAVVESNGRWLLARRADDAVNAGLYEFPTCAVAADADAAAALESHVRETAGLHVRVGEQVADVKHTITHHRIRVRAFAAELRSGARRTANAQWVEPASALDAGLTAAARKIARSLAARKVTK